MLKNKCNLLLCVLTLCSFTHPAFATLPVTISSPTPAISSSYNVGSSTTITHTITNNVSNLSFPITVSGISSPITRTTVANDCSHTLPAGTSTCDIGISIAPTLTNAGSSINQTLSVNYQGRTPLTSNLTFSVTVPVLIAAGEDDTGTSPPLLLASTNGSTAWSQITTTGFTTNGYFNAASCTGSGSSAICVAAGYDYTGTAPPLLVVSTDGGATWSKITPTGLTTSGFLNASGATGVS